MGDNGVFLGTSRKCHNCVLQKYFTELDAACNIFSPLLSS